MKKTLSLAFAALLCLSLASCDADQLGLTTQPPAEQTQGASQTSPAESGGEVTDKAPSVTDITSDAYGRILSGDRVINIDIKMASADLQSMRKYAADETYYPAEVTVDGVKCNTAGIRVRGNVTYVTSSQSQRYSYKLNFGRYGNGDINGLDELCLNNMAYDPSFLREYLTYKAFAYLDAKAPLVSLATVSVNGATPCVYLAVEAIDDAFLQRYFGEYDGNLYKAGRDSTLMNDATGFELKSGGDATLAKINELVSALKSKSGIEEILDVTSVLKYAAVNAVITNEDSYLGEKAQNYYLYEKDGKLTVLPWDYNLAFGTDTSARKDAYTVKTELATASVLEPYFGVTADQRPLVSVLLENEEYKKEYLSYVERLADYLDMAIGELDVLGGMIEDEVKNDTAKFYSYELFEKEYTDSPDALLGFMSSRCTSVRSQIK